MLSKELKAQHKVWKEFTSDISHEIQLSIENCSVTSAKHCFDLENMRWLRVAGSRF